MKQLLAITIFLSSLTGFSQTGMKKSLLPFNTLQVYDGIILNLIRSDSTRIELSGTNANPDQFSITETEGNLRIRVKQGGNMPDKVTIKLYYNAIKKIEALDKAEVWTENLITVDSIELVTKSGGQIYADLDVKYLSAKVIEGGLIKGDGYAVTQSVFVSSNGTFSGFTLEGEIGEITSSLGGKAKVNIEKNLTAKALSKGYIGYKGSPKLDSKTSLGGQIVQDLE